MKRIARVIAASGLADYEVGQKVQTREGYAGVILDVHEAPGDMTTYMVALDGGMGGGEYAEGEIWPDDTSVTTASRLANVEHTAADDYPELEDILERRLPPQVLSTVGSKQAGVEIPGVCEVCEKAIKIEKGALTHADGSNEHAVVPSEGAPLGVMAQKIALTLDMGQDAMAEANDTPEEKQGYEDGLADGKGGVTRNVQEPFDSAYRAGYDRGWAQGVQAAEPVVDDLAEENLLDDQQTVGVDPLGVTAGLWDFIVGNPPPDKYKGYLSHDWCRYRRDHECYYSKNLNVAASEQAGYAVWIPENRGRCQRAAWSAQQACPMALPGPNVPGGFTNATVPWEEGGQRGGTPSGVYRPQASMSEHLFEVETPDLTTVEASLDPVLAWHVTARWKDVQTKAKRIRTEGGVRIIAADNGVVVGHVRGDSNVYEAEIVRVPGKQQIGSWACGCKWGSYSWGRSGPWKRFEGRMCSHVLALQYEATSRGSFDRSMTLDEKQPAWMDTSIPVRTPGSFDRDKGRYSSLETGNRLVAEQIDDERPVVALVKAMQEEGARYAQIRSFAQALGVDDVPALVREARKTTSFPAKIRGLLRNLFIQDGKVIDEASGDEVDPRDVVHPQYDPVKGLDYREASLQSTAASYADIHKAKTLEEAADALSAVAKAKEPSHTKMFSDMASAMGGKMSGLDFRLKARDSLLRKMKAEAEQHPSPAAAAMGMSDSLRYTMEFPADSYTENAERVISELAKKGYGTRTKNYWQRGDAYNGVNVALTTPDGFPVELQFHTPESLVAKDQVHPLYEKWRTSSDPFEKARLGAQMRDLYDMVPRPAEALGIDQLKRQPTEKWKDWDWLRGKPRAAALAALRIIAAQGQPGPYRYAVLVTGQVVRFDVDDSTSEIFLGNSWKYSEQKAKINFFGDTDSTEISVAEAKALLEEQTGQVFEEKQTNPTIGDSDSAPAAAPVSQPVAVKGDSLWDDLDVDTIDEDPEAALPVTYGEEDEEEPKTASLTPEEMLAQVDSGEGVPAFLGHLGLEAGSSDRDIMTAAAAFTQKTALKTYTPAERQAFIDEGEDTGVTASNLDRLDIKGTHYEAMEASLAMTDDPMWLLDGDPNG